MEYRIKLDSCMNIVETIIVIVFASIGLFLIGWQDSQKTSLGLPVNSQKILTENGLAIRVELGGKTINIVLNDSYRNYSDDIDTSFIPDKWKRGLDYIRYTNCSGDLEQGDFMICYGTTLGVYIDSPDHIIIGNSTGLYKKLILVHEFSHFLWYNKLSQNIQTRWEKLYKNQTFTVNSYAKTNVAENFAEELTWWYMKKNGWNYKIRYNDINNTGKIELLKEICENYGCD